MAGSRTSRGRVRTVAAGRVNSERAEAGRSTRRGSMRVRYEEDGNAVRKIEEPWPEERPEKRGRVPREVSERTKQNRMRAASMSAGYVFFLSLVCVATVFLCIHYLQLRETLTNQDEKIAAMRTSLSKLQADNDAVYRQVIAGIDVNDIKATAINKLGMHYATESQIKYYDAADESYVRQYVSMPDTGS